MNLTTLNKTTFDKIKVGEVFGDGCETFMYILVKINEEEGMVIADESNSFYFIGFERFFTYKSRIYKLPLSVQRLWIGKGE